jgi:hypothetical protein
MTTVLDHFASHSPITAPGEQAALLAGLPASVAELRCVVQGLLLHVFWAERYGVTLPPERQAEVQLRWVARQLARIAELDPRPLAEARPPERRLVGNCRDFSVLLAALLREQGTPARARCGFGRYFLPNHFEDHWVCEYWNAEQARWLLVDAQLDDFQRAALGIAFDPLDVPRDQFIVGGQAWRMCRAGQADPETFGIGDMHGLWFVRGDFVRDVAALNKMELLPWDVWGLMERPDDALQAGDLALLDDLGALTRGDVPDYDVVRRLYESDSRLRVPPVIHSYVAGELREVEITKP